MSISDIETLEAAARAAMAAAEWDNAISYLLQLKARLVSTPNLTRNLAGGGSQSISWNSADIESLVAECRRQKAAGAVAASDTGPWQATKVTYTRAT
jgi:hypothetical protein